MIQQASMRQATYLWKNNRGIYFFRARIPKQLSEYFTGPEIKKSLKTDSYRIAVKQARAYRVELDKEMGKLEKGTYGAFELTLEGKVVARLPDGSERLVEGKITRNIGSPEESAQHKEYLIKQLREEAKRIEEQVMRDELHRAQLAAIQVPVLSDQQKVATGIEELKPSISLSGAIQEYITDRETLRVWKQRSGDQVKATLRDFLEIVGDKPITKIGRGVIAEYRQTLAKLPANRKKLSQFREKSIPEIVVMPNVVPMSLKTVENNLGRITPFFSWCVDREYISINPATGITKPLPKKKSGKQDRNPFTLEELQALFQSAEYSKFKEPYRYWVPIIALYHGMRLEEVCKLQLTEIKKSDGVLYFEIIDAKTKAGWRPVPIHRILIKELGFLNYIEQLKVAGHTRLFPELTRGRDGYGARVSKWFARYRKRCGITDSDFKKCFHSLRHNVVDQLRKEHNVEKSRRLAILGHEPEDTQDASYGSDYTAAELKPYLDLIDYGLNHLLLKFDV